MCYPLIIAGVAMTAASIYANAKANEAIAKKRDEAMGAELERQKGYRSEAAAVNDQSQARYQDFSGQQQQKAQSIGDYLAAQAKSLPADAPTEVAPDSANILVKTETAKQLGKAKAYGDQQDRALGNLRAFGDLLGGISREQAGDAAQLGTIGSFMKGSNAILPLELDAANSAGSGWKTAGTVLGAGGSLLTSAGIGGAGPSWGSLFGSSFGTVPGAVGASPISGLGPGSQMNPDRLGFGAKIGGV